MKYLKYAAVLLITANTLSAQEVKMKKEIMYLGEEPAFSYAKKAMGNELFVYALNTKEELVHIVTDNNNTESKVDDFRKIILAKQNTSISSQNFRSKSYEDLISLLMDEKVLNAKGEINEANLIRFKAKYDDGNVNKTMMR